MLTMFLKLHSLKLHVLENNCSSFHVSTDFCRYASHLYCACVCVTESDYSNTQYVLICANNLINALSFFHYELNCSAHNLHITFKVVHNVIYDLGRKLKEYIG